MAQLTAEQKQQIIAALDRSGARLPCPRCGNTSFSLLDGYFNQTIQAALAGMVIGGLSVPTAVVFCKRCGYLAQHALGVLKLLPKPEPKPEEVAK